MSVRRRVPFPSSRTSRRTFTLGALSTFAMCAEVAHAESAAGIHLLPLGGGVPDAELELVRRALEADYSERVSVLSNVELPKSAFYAPRSRYRAEKLLDFVRVRLPSGAFRIAGITAV